MAKAKPAQTEVAPDETVQAATEDQVTTSEQPTAAPEVTPTEAPSVEAVVDTYTREDGVRVTTLPGGTVREDY